MAHIDFSQQPSQTMNNPAWHRVGMAIGELANKWSGRDDIVAHMADEVSGGAPAAFKPLISEIEISTNQVFANVKPEEVGDLRERAQQYEFAKATGAVLHESLHAKYSMWSIDDAHEALKPEEFKAMMLLEEGRIESQGVKEMPWGKNFLQACAMDLVISDAEESFSEESDTYAAAGMVALLHARVIGGILDAEDYPELLGAIASRLPASAVEELEEVIKKFQAHNDHFNPAPLYPLARQWVKIVNRAAKENGEPPRGKNQQASQDFAEALRGAMQEAKDSTAIKSNDKLAQQEKKEKWVDQQKAKEEEAAEQDENKETAKSVFSRASGGKTRSVLVESRLPNSAERQAAVTIARMLEQAKYRERSQTEINSVTPPGRLRTRALVQRNAMRAKGIYQETAPWRRTVRKHTDDPDLTVGVMVDISGSMGEAMQPMATTAWVMSEAVKRVQGRTAMVYYGSEVFPTLKPGEHLTKVNVFSARDSTEEFDEAFRALDGGLNLLNGDGAKLLVVVSDGHYRDDQHKAAQQWVKKCGDSGVAVLWLAFGNEYTVSKIVKLNPDAQVLNNVGDPAATATEIGRAASTALTKVGGRTA